MSGKLRASAACLLALCALAPATPALAQVSFPDIEDEVMCDTCNVPLNIAEAPRADQLRREINKLIKEKGGKGISSQTQGEQVRVTGKKRDDLQAVMALLKSEDLGVPLQFENFRD